MVLFTIAGNIRQQAMPREAMQVLAIVIGSFLGTVLAGLLKGRNLASMFSERLAGVTITMGLGIGVGCVVVAAVLLRERHARDTARILKAEAERHQLEKNILEARLALMQAQVEPHFLFNTLANVQHLVETDPPAAARTLASLIKYLRAALPQMREASTNLGREVDMARAFLEIQQVRMGPRLAFRKHRCSMTPHHAREPGELPHAHRPRIHRREQPHDFRCFHAALEQLFHHRFRFFAGENVPRFRAINKRFCHFDSAVMQPQPCSVLGFPCTLLCLRRHENSNTTEPR